MTIATLIFANSNSSFLKVKSERLKKEQNYCHIVFGNSNRSQIISKILKHNKTIVTLHKCSIDIQSGCKDFSNKKVNIKPKLLSHCTNVQVIFSQGAKLHSFPNKLSRYILQEEWKVSRNIVVFCNIQKHNFFYFLARIEYMKQSSVIQGSDTKKMTKQCIIFFKRGTKPFGDFL